MFGGDLLRLSYIIYNPSDKKATDKKYNRITVLYILALEQEFCCY